MRFWFRSAPPVEEEERPASDSAANETEQQSALVGAESGQISMSEEASDAFHAEAAAEEFASVEIDGEDVPEDVSRADHTLELSIQSAPFERIRAEELPSAAAAFAELFPAIKDAPEIEEEDLVAEDEDVLESSQEALVEFSAQDIEEELRVAEGAPAPDGASEVLPEAPEAGDASTESSKEPIFFEPARSYEDWALEEKLASHREWIESKGTAGHQANLSGSALEGAELIGANLRFADLHDAQMKGADLLLADLREANLVRANLDDCCLVGTNLEGANLEGASLEGSMGLVPRQIAGANLRDASLPESVREFEHQTEFAKAANVTERYFSALAGVCALMCLLIWKTSDAQLLADSAIIPFLHSRAAAAALPSRELYLILPLALFTLYLVFEFQLQRLCEAALMLPAVFPDGRALGEKESAIVRGLLRAHFRWMSPEASSTGQVEESAALLAAHWIAPLTLFFFWARYLTVQELHGSFLHAVLFAVSAGVAVYVSTRIGRPAEDWKSAKGWARRLRETLRNANPTRVAGTLAIVLFLLSVGIATGVPHGKLRAPRYSPSSIRRWAATALWAVGIDPYADLTEATVSARPNGATGSTGALADDQIAAVSGAKLNNEQFRYAQAYKAFFANAHLYRTDFQGAFLSEADFRGADLSQANFRFAVMDGTLMSRANFDRANLDGAELARADLRKANMPYASLANAILTDARFDEASLYSANLALATLTRTNLQKADLRDAQLGMAHMSDVDARGAYLWSAKLPGADLGGAQLGGTILIDADLRGANLSGAQAEEAVFTGANLSGADLDGADLRKASGLTAYQVCTAKTRYGALLDDALEKQIDAQCAGAHAR